MVAVAELTAVTVCAYLAAQLFLVVPVRRGSHVFAWGLKSEVGWVYATSVPAWIKFLARFCIVIVAKVPHFVTRRDTSYVDKVGKTMGLNLFVGSSSDTYLPVSHSAAAACPNPVRRLGFFVNFCEKFFPQRANRGGHSAV